MTLPEGQTPTANAMWQPQRSGWFGYENDGNAFPVFYWNDGGGYGQTHRHFSIASEQGWHKENHS